MPAVAVHPSRIAWALVHPATLVLGVLVVHAAGRVAAFCYPAKVDSFTYAIAGYWLWQPDTPPGALVPDKPPGQALLTGWVYRFVGEHPSRLALIPIESAFMVAGYVLFYCLSSRLHGRRAALLLTGGLALATNLYNALDSTTDGFHLAENYLLAPTMLAVAAHLLFFGRVGVRGVLCGLGVGLALAIKQTAITLVVAIILHALVDAVVSARKRDRSRQLAWMLVGIAAVWLPISALLAVKGLWVTQVESLIHRSGAHIAAPATMLPPVSRLLPLLPMLPWIAVGLVGRVAAGSPPEPQRVSRLQYRSALLFACIWLVMELCMVQMMTKPAEHYWQQVVPPVALLAGFGARAFSRWVAGQRSAERVRVWRCVGVLTACLVLATAVPLFAVARQRVSTFDGQWEKEEFARRLAEAPAWVQSK